MTDSSEQFALLLADLWSRANGTGVILTEVEFTTPSTSQLLLGVDAKGQRHVLAPIPEDYAFKTECGESLELTDWQHPSTGVRYLDLICRDELLAQAFEQLTDSIVDRVAERKPPHIAIQEAVRDMKTLLRPGRKLSQEAARGLYGELVVLEWLARRNPQFALGAWTGPDGHVHDFSTKRGDLEVKASGNGSRTVVISSLGQLDEVANTPLVLIRLHVQNAPQGENLTDLVERIVAMGCNRADVVAKLGSADFRLGIDSDEHRFSVVDEPLAWEVGASFPGLRSTDLPVERGAAIVAVTYTLDLLAAPGGKTHEELSAFLDGMMTA